MSRSRAWPAGFTLFEVVLATALAAVLVGLLGTALHVYLDSVSVGRGDVEQAQLARAILARMSDDLRSAVRRIEQDVSAMGGSDESAGESSDSGGPQGSGGTGESSGSGGSSSRDSTSTTSSTDIASAAIPPAVPGLYGNQFQLQVDISRIPRFDELDALLQVDAPPAGYASDLRTVAYFLQQGDHVDESASAATEVGRALAQTAARSGLMRRELDRATALYSAELGGSQLITEDARLLAPEVTWMEFQYFDGIQLWQDWDSTARGGLPMAVEIRIWLRPPMPDTATADAPAPPPATTSGPGQNDQMYRLVVHLPSAEPSTVTDTSATGSTGTTGGSSGSTGFGSGGGAR